MPIQNPFSYVVRNTMQWLKRNNGYHIWLLQIIGTRAPIYQDITFTILKYGLRWENEPTQEDKKRNWKNPRKSTPNAKFRILSSVTGFWKPCFITSFFNSPVYCIKITRQLGFTWIVICFYGAEFVIFRPAACTAYKTLSRGKLLLFIYCYFSPFYKIWRVYILK